MKTDGRPLTKEEREERIAEIQVWMRGVFKSDFDKLCFFAATMMERSVILETENEDLVNRLNGIYEVAWDLSSNSKLPGYVRSNIASVFLEFDPEHPASRAFLSGLEVSKQLQAAANAYKSHAANHAMKAEVFAWCDANLGGFRSMDAAAQAIAGKIAPIAFRTARSWVGEWKKLRSASTA